MGQILMPERFDEAACLRFGERLRQNLEVLRVLLGRPSFSEGETTIGAELELFLVDGKGRPLSENGEVLARTTDRRFTLEIDRFNVEFNALPCLLAGRPFSAKHAELAEALREITRAASEVGGRVVPIGILPTLRRSDLEFSALSDAPRYRALARRLREKRKGPFHVRIDGADPLAFDTDDIALEGAGTSFQVHLRVPANRFAQFYNAAQIATIPALAASGNSPFLVGHRLWEETRIALFKQSVDDRVDHAFSYRAPSRVSFGHGWARHGAYELFAESVALHSPIFPVCSSEDPVEALRLGKTPELSELRLHHGTVWNWNRAVYDPAGGGHLRIEMRALPAGPTLVDMVANAAFLLGLTLGLVDQVDDLMPAYPFVSAEHAFYRAAQSGLSARLPFPQQNAPGMREVDAKAICLELLPTARRGLVSYGVAEDEADHYLAIVASRVRSGRTGARWQRSVFESFLAKMPRDEALSAMLLLYQANVETGEPVSAWPLESEAV